MGKGLADGHAVFAHCLLKTGLAFGKIGNRIGGAKVTGLFVATVDQLAGGKVSPLHVVDKDAATVDGIETGVQKHHRQGCFEKATADAC